MVEIRVDPDELESLAARLNELGAEFSDLERLVHGFRDAVGHDGLADELECTATNWSKKRSEVLADLQAMAGIALHAALHYRAVEGDVTATIRRKSGPAS